MNGPEKKDPKFEGAGKLIGGFAAGNLSEQEKEALFGAALHDQDLFDSLMEEQALKDLLEEPGVKAELVQALQPKVTLLDRIKSFLATPIAWGTLGAVATAAVLLVVILPTSRREAVAPQTAQVRPEESQRKEAAQPMMNPPRALSTPPVPQASSRADEKKDAPRGEPLPEMKEQEKREQAAAQPQQSFPQPQQSQQGQQGGQQAQLERDRRAAPQMQQAPPAPPAVQQQQPVPAAALGALSQLLAVDYALVRRTADGSYQTATAVRSTDTVRLQIMPSESGFVSLYRRNSDGVMTTVAAALPVARGQVMQIPQQGSLPVGDGTFVLMLSRDAASADATKSAVPGSATQGFRQNAGQVRAKRASAGAPQPASPPAEVMMDSSLRKAVLPSAALGRVTAASSDAGSIAVEITIRAEN